MKFALPLCFPRLYNETLFTLEVGVSNSDQSEFQLQPDGATRQNHSKDASLVLKCKRKELFFLLFVVLKELAMSQIGS